MSGDEVLSAIEAGEWVPSFPAGVPAGVDATAVVRLAYRMVREKLGTLASRGGGCENFKVLELAPHPLGWRLRFELSGEYRGANPAFDPPWSQAWTIELVAHRDLGRVHRSWWSASGS